jgi:hypothetical protein
VRGASAVPVGARNLLSSRAREEALVTVGQQLRSYWNSGRSMVRNITLRFRR